MSRGGETSSSRHEMAAAGARDGLVHRPMCMPRPSHAVARLSLLYTPDHAVRPQSCKHEAAALWLARQACANCSLPVCTQPVKAANVGYSPMNVHVPSMHCSWVPVHTTFWHGSGGGAPGRQGDIKLHLYGTTVHRAARTHACLALCDLPKTSPARPPSSHASSPAAPLLASSPFGRQIPASQCSLGAHVVRWHTSPAYA